ncbi:MAG: methyl-accepting chemotaxis protein [Pseudomonadota bacterium]
MTVTRIFTIAFLFVGLLAVAKFAASGYGAFSDYRTIAQMRATASAATKAIDATVALSLERSVMEVALALDDPIPTAFRAIISKQREKAERGFDQVLAELDALPGTDSIAEFRQTLVARRAEMDALRRRIDIQINAPLSERNISEITALPIEFNDGIGTLKATVGWLRYDVTLVSPVAKALQSIQSRSWEAREYAGRARTAYAIATLRAQAIPDDAALPVKLDRDRADQAWRGLVKIARTLKENAALRERMDAVEQAYFTDYLSVADRIDRISAQESADVARAYGVEFREFFALSNAGLDALAKLANVAGGEISAYWRERETKAFFALIFSVLLLCALIGVIWAAISVVRMRVTRRLEEATAALTRVSDGDLQVDLQAKPSDLKEIAALVMAVAAFRDKLVELQDTENRATADAAALEARAQMLGALQGELSSVVSNAVIGDFTGRVPAMFEDEELNEFAHDVNRLLETVHGGVGETGRVLAAMAKGDLDTRMEGSFFGAFAELQCNANETVERLDELVAKIAANSGQVRSSAGEITGGAEDLSSRAEHQASALEETAATMEEMSASIKSNADNSASASALAGEASGRAAAGGAIVASAVTAMHEIETSATKIADIISVIDGIAFQTNLLALNAAVEAARAGDAGKGFAVVASEVRALAQRSSDAARDIRGLIETSAGQVSEGVRLVRETGASLEGIATSIGEVESAVRDIASASVEQASGVEEITSSISHMDQMTQQNAAVAEQSAATARELTAGAERLQALLTFFKSASIAADAPTAEAASSATARPEAADESADDSAWRAVAAEPPQAALAQQDTARDEAWAEF